MEGENRRFKKFIEKDTEHQELGKAQIHPPQHTTAEQFGVFLAIVLTT